MPVTPSAPPLIAGPIGGIPCVQFRRLLDFPQLTHAVTAVPANLATHVGRGREKAETHRRAVCAGMGLDYKQLTSTRQVHSTDVFVVGTDEAGIGRGVRDGSEPAADALVTDRPGVGLLALSADCPLVMVFDPVRSAVGVAHASWKGTVGGVTGQLVDVMRTRFGCDPRSMSAAMAPSAGPCCYEVGTDVVEAATASLDRAERHFARRDGRWYFDLWSANAAQLIDRGLRSEAIERANVCTICDRRFFSYRREGPQTGRFALIAAIRP